LQTVINVSTMGGFEPTGRALITAQKLRLLHAGLRRLTRELRPDYEPKYGVPVNQEDMLATMIGFSLLVIEGWNRLGAGVSEADQEDYFYLWMTFARLMGVHPPYEHDSTAYIPSDVADARVFYAAYSRRHYKPAAENPEGVALAAANLDMLRGMIPSYLKFLGFGLVPRMTMLELMGPEACARLGIATIPGHFAVKWFLNAMHAMIRALQPKASVRPGPHDHHTSVSMIMLQELITRSYGGVVAFNLPTEMAQVRQMVRQTDNGLVVAQPEPARA
jgi:hypothetical protein